MGLTVGESEDIEEVDVDRREQHILEHRRDWTIPKSVHNISHNTQRLTEMPRIQRQNTRRYIRPICPMPRQSSAGIGNGRDSQVASNEITIWA